MGNYFWAPGTELFRPNVRVLLGGTVKNTGRLLRMLPGFFREFSREQYFFSFLQGMKCVFWRSQSYFSGGSKMRLFVRIGAITNGYLNIFAEYYVLRTGNIDGTLKRRLWRNGKVLEKALGKLTGESCGNLPVELIVPPSKNRGFSAHKQTNKKKKNVFQEPFNFFSIIRGGLKTIMISTAVGTNRVACNKQNVTCEW